MAWGTYFLLSLLQQSAPPPPSPKYTLGVPKNYSDGIEPPEVPRRLNFFNNDKQLLSFRNDGWVDEWRVEENESVSIAQTQEMFTFLPSNPAIVIRETSQDVTKIYLEAPTKKYLVTEGLYIHSAADNLENLLALSKGDNMVEVWDLRQPKRTAIWKTKNPVRNGIDISGDGRLVAAAEETYDDSNNLHHTIIEVWDLGTNEPRLLWGKQGSEMIRGVWNVLFSPDNSQLVMDTQMKGKSGFQIVDAITGTLIVNQQGNDSYWMRSLAFSPDGQFLASGDEFGNITAWNTSDGTKVWHIQTRQVVESLAFSRNSNLLAAGLRDTTIYIWDVSSLRSASN